MISEYTKFYNQDGEVFKALVYDKDKQELPEITNINDINKGALHNALEYTRRWGLRCIQEISLQSSKTFLLDAYGELVGEERNGLETDVDYKNRILANILLTVSTINNIYALINNEDVVIQENMPSGFLNHSFLDIGIVEDDPIKGCIMTFPRNAIYIIYKSTEDFVNSTLVFLNSIKAAGTAIYVGFQIARTYDFLFAGTPKGFLDSDFFLGEVIEPPYEPPEPFFVDLSHINNTFIGAI